MKKDTLKKHINGKCSCRRTLNTTGRYAKACKVPGTQEAGNLAMMARTAVMDLPLPRQK